MEEEASCCVDLFLGKCCTRATLGPLNTTGLEAYPREERGPWSTVMNTI